VLSSDPLKRPTCIIEVAKHFLPHSLDLEGSLHDFMGLCVWMDLHEVKGSSNESCRYYQRFRCHPRNEKKRGMCCVGVIGSAFNTGLGCMSSQKLGQLGITVRV
jgi:hypothetical protein